VIPTNTRVIQHNGGAELPDVVLLVGRKCGEPEVNPPAPHHRLEVTAQPFGVVVMAAHGELGEIHPAG
jgi:hypothetical protein